MYDLSTYGAMIADKVRMNAHEAALRRVVTADSVVLDIGAGPGVMSLLAARMGARKVYGVEPNSLIRVGARLAAENGFSDRISFIRGLSQQIELPEMVDVVVCDLRGWLPNIACHVDAVADARRRLMKPEGTLIPLRDTIYVAPVEAGEAYTKLGSAWCDDPFGLKMTGAAAAILNQGPMSLTSHDRLLGSGRAIATLEYLSVESPDIGAAVELPVEASGTVHGLSIWFETELVEGVGFSTAPDRKETVYGRVFLPLAEPQAVEEGDRILAIVRTEENHGNQTWVWRGQLTAPDGSKKASFASTSAFFNPENPDVHEVFHERCVPTLSDDGRITREVLLGVDGNGSVAGLAASIAGRYPGRFEYEDDAVNFVRDVLERFGDATLRLED